MADSRPMRVAPSSFTSRGHTLAYTEFGEGKRWVLLMPGLLIPALMQERLARALAAAGSHVLTLDPLGHGGSDRPRDMKEYSIESFAADAIALLDHLDIDEAVIGGTSLGANVTLEVAHLAPNRVRGMILEMPVLENGLVASVIAFGPLLVGLHFGEQVLRPVAAAFRRIPRWALPFWGNVAFDAIRQEPGPSAALLRGLFFSHIAPHSAQRRELRMPALVVGHHIDPVHPFSDARACSWTSFPTRVSSKQQIFSNSGSGPNGSLPRSPRSSPHAGPRALWRNLAVSAVAPPDDQAVRCVRHVPDRCSAPPCPERDPARLRPAPRHLSRRAAQLGSRPGPIRELLLHR